MRILLGREEGDTNPFGVLQDVIVGRTLTMAVSPFAEILAVEGLEDIWDAVGSDQDPVAAQMTQA